MTQGIIFRADGNSAIGLGHIMRLLALCDMLREEFNCVFVTRADTDDKVKKLIRNYCQLVEINASEKNDELQEVLSVAHQMDVVVLDGYHFDQDYQRALKSKVAKLVMIDDLAQGHFVADIIINHGNSSIGAQYDKESYTRVLAGHAYLLLRKEFREAAHLPYRFPGTRRLFVSMGGADPLGLTLKIVDALVGLDGIDEINVVTGSAFKHLHELKAMISKSYLQEIVNLLVEIDPVRMVSLLRQCSLSLLPASTMALEACCVGTGLITGLTADNQRYLLEELENGKCAVSLKDFRSAAAEEIKAAVEKSNNETVITELVSSQRRSFDGNSGKRIVEIFKSWV